MVNASLNWASIVGIVLAVCGAGLYFMRSFKPALARGELHCVGATTLKEYRENIEKDAALERRFQKVLVIWVQLLYAYLEEFFGELLILMFFQDLQYFPYE